MYLLVKIVLYLSKCTEKQRWKKPINRRVYRKSNRYQTQSGRTVSISNICCNIAYGSSVAQEKVELFPSVSKSALLQFLAVPITPLTFLSLHVAGSDPLTGSFLFSASVHFVLFCEQLWQTTDCTAYCVYCPIRDPRITVCLSVCLDGFSAVGKVWKSWMLSGGTTRNLRSMLVLLYFADRAASGSNSG